MSRPLFMLLTGLVLGEAFVCLAGRGGLIILALFIPAAVILSFSPLNKWGHFVLFSFLISFSAFAGGLLFYMDAGPDQTAEKLILHGDGLLACGRVVSLEKKAVILDHLSFYQKRSSVRIRTEERLIPSAKMTVSFYDDHPAQKQQFFPGDRLEIRGICKALPTPTNPGEFDTGTWYLGQGIRLMMTGSRCRLLDRPAFSLRAAAWIFRQKISSIYHKAVPAETALLLDAMVLGDRTGLDPQLKKIYSDNGAAHLLAVSGLHVSIIGGALFRLMKKKGAGYLLSCLFGGCIIFFYGCMTGFASAVTRAVIMYLVYLLAQAAGQTYDIISAMSLSGLLLLVSYPVRILDGGFQVSYAAVLAIGLVLPWIREKKGGLQGPAAHGSGTDRRRTEKIREALLSGIVISAVTAPVLMHSFYEWAPAGILLNLLLLPCMMPLMVSGVCGGLAGLLSVKAAAAVLLPARLLLDLFGRLFLVTAALQIRPVITGCPAVWQMLLIYLGEAALILLYIHPDILLVTTVILSAGLFCLADRQGSVSLLAGRSFLTIDMLDVGQGDCLLIRTPDRKALLIDGGSSSRDKAGQYVILPALKYYGVRQLDYVLVSHMDSDHYSGIPELMDAGFPIKNLWLPDAGRKDPAWQLFYDLADSKGIRVTPVGKGDVLTLRDIKLTCLHPKKCSQPEDRNESSMVLALSFHHFDMLFTGDAGSQSEEEIAASHPAREILARMDVLKVGHHGSRYSTGEPFLALLPHIRAGLISAGRGNRYGHPHPELRKRLAARGIRVYDTPRRGALRVRTDGYRFFIRGFHERIKAAYQR